MNKKMKHCNNISNETRSSNWLSVIPMRQFNYVLNKQQFCNFIRLRYGWPIPSLMVLVVRMVKALMFSKPCYARREDSLPCDTTK